LVAEGIRAYAPLAQIENVNLPEWGMESLHPEPLAATAVRTGYDRYWLDIPGLGDCLRRSVVDSIILDSYAYNIDHYPPRAVSKKLLGNAPEGGDARGFGRHHLVCSVRGAEILGAVHPDYLVLPPAYYKMLAERSGLGLIFYGQLGDDPYSESLRLAFPESQFVPGRNPQYDFDMLRRSVNIAPSISTFAWLAAWLSDAEQVYLPVGGIFSPMQHYNQVWIPLDEPSYKFILLPFCKAVDISKEPEQFKIQQDLIAQLARPVGVTELRGIFARAMGILPRRPYVGGFDPEFYLAKNPDIAAYVRSGAQSALEHYVRVGYLEKTRPPTLIDSRYYLNSHPDVAQLIAEGYYADPLHHYTSVGWSKGYAAIP
jgi:hypothetical protein